MNPKQLKALFTSKVVQRFWRKISVGEPSACWLWERGTDKNGYGKFQITLGGHPKQLHLRSHRVAHFLATGTLAPVVMHTCDTPLCCNPAHLISGTQQDNRLDCVAKKRHALGDRIHNTKLTETQVAEIQQRCRVRGDATRLAQEYGVAVCTISAISTGKYPRLLRAALREEASNG